MSQSRFSASVLPHPAPQRQSREAFSEAATSCPPPSLARREKRVLLTPQEEQALEDLVGGLARTLRTSLKTSHVLRAAIAALLRAEDDLLRQARTIGPLTRPPNGSASAIASFERALADLIVCALTANRGF